MRHLSYQRFMEEFRPNGYGVIRINDDPEIRVHEVVCDFCNALIPEGDDIWLIGSHAICKECAERYGDK